ncbi:MULTISPECIES: glycoside hydrolase family 13 protein [unclassified Brenneria]|uniref:glycoside hydrolase family 13 protein n=1 Tax=unclassified Brenneria TaxID=2634434 RepID=UPI0018F07CBA|nr:alpha-glucosidase [Brenneria sp. L3-3C-1]MBJ7224171.1 alpha-glucosidase [Brenneria sp. L3-3C-1]MEE3645416.1 alpha-glucosidase [Brenneria sp. L3_3C_1]
MEKIHLCGLAVIASLANVALSTEAGAAENEGKWWKESVVYQIYPRSFNDSNGDGIGDINGITEKLDYLKNLGVDTIWLNPHFDSPNADNGFDIRDYRKVMAEYGTMQDFDNMMHEIKQRNMRLIIDLVVNHTSDEHHWFQESRKSKDNPYRDYYFWRDGRNGNVPNNYRSFFSSSAWEKDDATGQYYLHYYNEKQPDLNWDNKKVRNEVYDIMRFWLDKGVSGFRMDVIPFISKHEGLRDLPADELTHPEFFYARGPHVHEYLQEMNREVLSHYDTMTVGEAFGVTFEDAPKFINADRNELNMLFHFDIVRLDRDNWRKTTWTLPQLKATYQKIEQVGKNGWNTSFLSNHDNPRAVSHFGDDSDQWRVLSAKALATMMLTQRATPFLYQGDELGMTDYPFKNIEDYDDVEAKGRWVTFVESGKVPAEEYLDHLRQTSRDNARTPMQWSAEANAGFTKGTPWFHVNPNYKQINAASQINQQDSIYNYHRELIALRRQTPALIYGEYRDLDPQHDKLFAYTRTQGDQQYLVVINFTHDNVEWNIPEGKKIVKTLISNRTEQAAAPGDNHLTMQPWQAAIFQM